MDITTCSLCGGMYAAHLKTCPVCPDEPNENTPLGTAHADRDTSPLTIVQFVVVGQPVAKQRPRTHRTRRGYQTHTPQKTKDYEALIAQHASVALAGRPMFDKRTELSLTLTIWRDNARRADIDNIVKSVMDGMEGVLYHNDSQVLELHARLHRKSAYAGVNVVLRRFLCPVTQSRAA